MELGVGRAAERLAVSERQVRKLIAKQLLPARMEGGRWLIDEASLRRSPPVSRPMSPRIAWAMIAILSGDKVDGLRADERQRLVDKIGRLQRSDEPLSLLRAWLVRRADRRCFVVAAEDAAELRGDERVALSGISDERSGLSAPGEVEGYVRGNDLAQLRADYLLADVGSSNVWFHLSDRIVDRPVPIGLVVADLADRLSPREDAAARRLLGGVLK
jgi:excisionase family DNA binding protein